MHDGKGRVIDYLRISVTDRCNFRCVYCMPPEGVQLLEMKEVLTFEEMLRIIAVLSRAGVNKIRLTGGEPLVRLGITDFIRNIKKLGTIKDLAMTTNGSLLAKMAHDLKAAGLDRVNISLDTVDPGRFHAITRQGSLADVFQGIDSALEAGLAPVKLNVVLSEMLSQEDVAFFINQVYTRPIAVRFIEYMPLGDRGLNPGPSIDDVKKMIEAFGLGPLRPATPTKPGNGPARYFRFARGLGMFGFITPISDHYCESCNRIRLTADGKLKPCLLSDDEVDIRGALRRGASDEEILRLFGVALDKKPARHGLYDDKAGAGLARGMFQIGG